LKKWGGGGRSSTKGREKKGSKRGTMPVAKRGNGNELEKVKLKRWGGEGDGQCWRIVRKRKQGLGNSAMI